MISDEDFARLHESAVGFAPSKSMMRAWALFSDWQKKKVLNDLYGKVEHKKTISNYPLECDLFNTSTKDSQ